MGSSKTLTLLCILAVFISLPTKSQSTFEIKDASFINNICKQTPNPKLCNAILQSDPRGSTADVTGLALILVDKIKGNAKATKRQIDVLYKEKPELKKQLDECSFNYKVILEDDVPEAQQALTLGNPKFAEDGVTDAGTEAASCEGEFKGASPLTRLTRAMRRMSDIARAIVRMLL